jgi:bifunctional DNA-binding transcriptional regulator/antitoxin component of YhaV-PrlF toxin-antitoxin module
MQMASQVTTRGQITIDRVARKALGVRPGMAAHQRVVAGRLEVLFLPAPHVRSLAGALRLHRVPAPPTSNEEIERAVQEAVAEESDV